MFLFNVCRTDVILPKTPATTRRRKPTAAQRTRTLRSTAARKSRESVDSAIEVEMSKKSRGHLDVVTEKADEEQTVVQATDIDTQATATRTSAEARRKIENTHLTATRTSAEVRRKVDENKENIRNVEVADDSKQLGDETECVKDRHGDQDTRQSCNISSALASVVSPKVLMFYCLL